ncbi:MAG TPA: helix-turn-helix domain-containing protein [Chloroflexota bacterium]
MSDLGNLLRSARDKKGVSISQAAEVTRIRESYLEALEEGQFKLLPGPAYITGFLRNYASYLGIHPDDAVQEYYATRPFPQPGIKAATRVLASGHERYLRKRILWTLGVLTLMLCGAFAIYQYNDTYAHPYSAPLITPANIGGTSPQIASVGHVTQPLKPIYVRLRATAPVWVRVTVDGHRAFQGILRPRSGSMRWVGYHAIYVLSYDGAHLVARYDGRPMGRLANRPGTIVDLASASSWHPVS